MKTKNNSNPVENAAARKHLSQSVYSLVITYKQYSRSHYHSIIFSITKDKSLVVEVNKYLSYSYDRLREIYPWMDNIQLYAYKVSMIPSDKYRIAPATASCSAFLREQIYVTPYDARVVDFSFCPTDNDNDIDDLPF